MSKNTLIITAPILFQRTELHTNTDEKLISPTIKRVQDMKLMPILGTTLFNKIQDLIEQYPVKGTMPDSDYKVLLDDYIIDVMCNYVMAELPIALGMQFFNKGVATIKSNDSTDATPQDISMVTSNYRIAAENYAERLRRFLIQNATTKYPEFYRQIAGVDIMPPNGKSFELPIYFGRTIEQRQNPSDNLPDERFN
jgi:hypothetical protein